MIENYGECLNENPYLTIKDTLPLIALKSLPVASNATIPPFLPVSEAVLEFLFCVFSCPVMAVSIDSECFPFAVILTSEKAGNGPVPGPVKKVGDDTLGYLFTSLPFHWMARRSNIHCIFYHIL